MSNKLYFLWDKYLLYLVIITNILSFTIFTNYNFSFSYFKYFSFLLFFFSLFLRLFKFNKIKLNNKIINLFFIIFIWVILSNLNNKLTLSNYILFISYFLVFLLSFVIIPNLYSNIFILDKQFYKGLNFAVFLLIFIGIITGNDFYLSAQNRLRYIGVFKNPNYIGLFSFLGFIISFKLFIIKKKNIYKFSVFFYIFLSFLTNSRTSILSIFIFLFIYFILFIFNKFNINSKKIFIILIFVLSIFILLILFNFIDFKFINKLLSNRIEIWLKVFDELRNWEILFGKKFDTTIFSGSISYDNFYLNQLLQFGILGLIGLLSIIIYVLSKIMKTKYNIQRFYLSFMITWLVYSFFESVFLSVGNIASLYFWFNIGHYFYNNNLKKVT